MDDKPGGSDTGPPGTSSTPFRSDSSDASSPGWRAGTSVLQLHPPPASSVGPDDSASQVAGRIYAAELAQQHRDARAAGASSSALAPASRSGPGADSHRSRDRKDPLPLPVPEEPEAVQHEDSGIRFREGTLPVPPAEVDRIEEEPPEYTPAS